MISFEHARLTILKHGKRLKAQEIPLEESHGLVLAKAIRSPINQPGFHQAAMDGYAVAFESIHQHGPLQIAGIRKAGVAYPIRCGKKEAIRIFTGAELPVGTDTVIAQELVELRSGCVVNQDPALFKGKNVRPRGSQFSRGIQLLTAGQALNAGAIALLAAAGIHKVRVFPAVRVAVLVTGDELKKPGSRLSKGEVYESNGITLGALIKEFGFTPVAIEHCKDDAVKIRKSISSLLKKCDVLLVTGGVSVGDFDFVPEAVRACGLKTVFHKVKQKPAKPVLFAKSAKNFVFGLPGNPGSVITAFYTLVEPLLQVLCGRTVNTALVLESGFNYSKKPGLTHVLKATRSGNKLFLMDQQESYKVSGFAHAEGLVIIDEFVEEITEKSPVTFMPIR